MSTDQVVSWLLQQSPIVVLLAAVVWGLITERLVAGAAHKRSLDTIAQQQATNAQLAEAVRDSNETSRLILDTLRTIEATPVRGS